jgi:regulatory protein
LAQAVTALKVSRRNARRVDVHLDGTFAFSLARVLAAGLRPGQLLSDADVATLLRRDAEEGAYQQGMRLIARRARTEREIRQAWARRKVDPEAQEAAMARLRQTGQVSDAAFAGEWVENRQAFRPRSAAALRVELRRRGVADEAIGAAVAQVDDEQAALAAAARLVRRLDDPSYDSFRQRLGSYLARRGFDHGTIALVVKRMWDERTDQDISREVAQ